jgi:hypothetical protein
MKTARFWDWVGGSMVRISLQDGEVRRWSKGGTTDEGWSSEILEWRREGSVVYFESVIDGRDCDGRLCETSKYQCSLDNLATREVKGEGLGLDGDYLLPTWERVGGEVYDEYARMAGY